MSQKNLSQKNSTGYLSTGEHSTGYRSTGDYSTGSWSVGYRSTGEHSTGCYSTGDWSTGNCSTGYRSTGDYSTGDYSTGDWSISDRSTGHFSTEDYSGFGCFDKPCSKEDWENWKKPKWLHLRLTEWIPMENMTESEKKDNPTYKTTGGYLKTYSYQEAFQRSYNMASRKEQLEIKNCPNFDAEKFYQISGIRIDEEPQKEIEIDRKKYRLAEND